MPFQQTCSQKAQTDFFYVAGICFSWRQRCVTHLYGIRKSIALTASRRPKELQIYYPEYDR